MIAIINRSYYKTAQRIFLHSLFWVCLTLMYVITYSRLDKDNAWVLILKDLLAVVTIFYSTAYIVIPKLFMKGKYILCFLDHFDVCMVGHTYLYINSVYKRIS